jgi:hypothetical protein
MSKQEACDAARICGPTRAALPTPHAYNVDGVSRAFGEDRTPVTVRVRTANQLPVSLWQVTMESYHFSPSSSPSCSALTQTGKYLVGVFLALIVGMAFSVMPAMAQSPQKASLAGHTPKPVLEGAAKVMGHFDPSQKLRLVIGLQPPKLAEKQQFLKDLQDKNSPLFHKFLTAEQWNARFAPSATDEQAVLDWAQAQGLTVTHRYPNRLVVDFEAPAATIESALSVTINNYQLDSKLFYSNDREPMIPVSLSNIIHSLGGLNSLQVLQPGGKGIKEPDFAPYVAGPVVSKGRTGSHAADGTKLPKGAGKAKNNGPTPGMTNGAYDPTDIFSSEAYDTNALYAQGHCCNPLHNPGVTPPETSIAIATAGTQDPNDFTGFHNQYSYLADHWQQFYIDGTPSCCDGEGTMDMEWSTAMANSFGSYVDTAMVYMYDGVNANFSTFTDIYNQMLTDGYARVFSTSWGCAEFDCVPQSTMDTDHAIFDSMVGQGWTLVSISHDGGATTSCVHHDAVNYPGSDPDVVASGGTTLSLSSGPIYNSEVGWTGGPDGCAANDGGSGGGVSAYWAAPSYQGVSGNRQVPDIALNADWFNTPQNMFFGGALQGNGGTSIVAPEVAGFMANENAYLLSLGNICGGGSSACAPIGNANYLLYQATGAPHNPFYDITSGCNNNDVTAFYSLGYFCAGPGRDMVTGWGSFNMLQLGWAFNWFHVPGFTSPTITFSGPATNHWYNTDQVVSWTVTAPPQNIYPSDGVAGFSQAWDSDPGDVSSHATPGTGDSFYSGPQYPNATAGCLDFTGASCVGSVGQGMHMVNVRAWGNEGEGSGDATYGPIGYDTIAPVTAANLSGTLNGSTYVTAVQVTLSATDNASGVASTVFQLDGGALQTYTGPFAVSAAGAHSATFHSTDVAGNVEGTKFVNFTITEPTATSLTSSKNPSGVGQSVVFTSIVTSTSSVTGTAIGTVTFKDGASTLATKTLVSGKATYSTSALALGNHSITSTYSGSTHFFASSSGVLTQVVKDASATTLISSLNPSTFGQAVTFTATVTHTAAPIPTGTVTFMNGGAALGTGILSGGKAKFTTTAASPLAAGAHSITAVYGGDSNYEGSTSTVLHQTVNKDATSSKVTSSLNPSNFGQTVTFTASVKPSIAGAPTPTGTVKFMDGATLLSTKTLGGGIAAFSTSSLAVGTHHITTVYGGSLDYVGSTSPVLTQTVH